jgi:hypothetical protein
VQNLLNKFSSSLDESYRILKNNTIDLSQQGSRTSSGSTLSYSYLSDLHESFIKITEIYRSIAKDNIKNLVTSFLASHISIEKLEDLKFCKNIYETYLIKGFGQNVIYLYITILQNTINKYTGSSEGKELIKQIIKDVEEMKTNTLLQGVSVDFSDSNKSSNVVQRLLQKFNLVPDSVDRELSDLLKDITDQTNSSFQDIAKLLSGNNIKKFGFVIIKKVIPRPISHNIWTLVSKEYLEANDLFQEKLTGINIKSLERGKTITISTVSKKEEKPPKWLREDDFIIFINDSFDKTDPSKNYYFVLETFDLNKFHFLIPWSSDIKYMPATWLEQLQNVKNTPSRRVTSYNFLLNSEILKHLQKPFVEISQFSREEIQKEESYWRSLRTIIKNSIIKYAKDVILKWESISLDRVSKLLASADFYKMIVAIIVEQISVETSNIEPVKQKRLDEELFISYFRDIDKIPKGLKRDVIDTYKNIYEEKLRKIIGSGKVPESKIVMVRNYILSSLEEIIDEPLLRYINRKSNIYITLDRKIDLLNNTLNQ